MTDQLRDSRDLPIFIHSELDDLPLTAEAFRVYAHLARRAGKDNCAWPSYPTIGEQCFRPSYPAASTETLKRKAMAAVKELIAYGLIVRELRLADDGGNATNVYHLTPRHKWKQPE
jgi:hypothetical protein